MFDQLSEKFSTMFRNLSGRGRISESNVRQSMEMVRTALLEADVQFSVVEDFTTRVLQKAIGTQVLNSVEPGQQMVKIVFDELVALMGPVDTRIMLVDPPPTIIMMCGLQGSGKTTTCGKLGLYLKAKGKNPLLVAADTQRPAAMEQLATLGQQADIAVYREDPGANPVAICRRSIDYARQNGRDVVILDTAGRLHIDDQLMAELQQIGQVVKPHQVFLVVDAMVGQDAVNSAKVFNEKLELDGIILTKFDSDTRGGAAISVKAVTGKPIKFLGVGEKLQALEEFHPDRIAQRILGMGDILTLVEKAQMHVDEAKAAEMQDKLAKDTFTLDDFLDQMRSIRKMGPLKQLLGMLPGIGGALKDVELPEEELNRVEAIIQSMTAKERQAPENVDASRRRRISRGSGTMPDEVSRLIKSFSQARDMFKKMNNMSLKGRYKAMKELQDISPGTLASGNMGSLVRPPPSRMSPQQKRRAREKRRRGK